MLDTMIVAPVTSQKRHYTYELSYPEGYISETGEDMSGRVFYVGKGTGDRIHQHEVGAARSDKDIQIYNLNLVKCQEIRRIQAQGKQVVKTIVYETDDERDACIYEWALINLIYQGRGLTNRNPAGRTCTQPKKEQGVKTPKPTLLGSDDEESLTAEEVMQDLGWSRATLERYASTGEIRKYRRMGERKVRFRKSEIDDLKKFRPIQDE